MNKNKLILYFVFASLFFPSISFAENKVDQAKIKIGVLLPLTGPFARYGMKIQETIAAFSNEKIKFFFEDEGCDPNMAVKAYKKLSGLEGISLFLGPWCGSPQSAISPLIKSNQDLAVLGSSAPEKVYELSGGRMFSTQASIEKESHFLAEKLNEFVIKSTIIIFKENQFSRAHEAAFKEKFKGKIIATLAYNSEDLSELKTIALKVKQLQPQALYIPDAFPILGGIFKELNNVGLKSIPVYSVYSVQSEDVLKVVGENGKNMIYSYPDIGEKEALEVFPKLAAELLVNAAIPCAGNNECMIKKLTSENTFDHNGVLSGELKLKTIKENKFVSY